MSSRYGYLRNEKGLLNWLVNKVLRSGWSKHPVKQTFTLRAKTYAPIGKNGRSIIAIQCEGCYEYFRPKDVQVNHKVHCVQNGISWDELPAIIRRMFDVGLEDLEHLCKECHDITTYSERYNCTKEEAKLHKKAIKFSKKSAKEQKELLVKAGMKPASSAEKRRQQVFEYLKGKTQ